ncbi:MAG: 2-hydroxyglutaryl-CoA dehydratase, partial [Fastidiosipila sp.]|nr:2-hydroxyglutaryl-CoA dehydratase [Fastidiosipila sp.]
MNETINCNRALGIDIGSTTAKIVFTVDDKILYERYERHFSEALGKTLEMLASIKELLEEAPFTMAISGSAGLGVSEASDLPFVQEVYATGQFIQRDIPDAGVVIELGGEDAKVLFFEGGTDARMNGTCAGGTGAFIDQMASLLDMTIAEMDAASLEATRLYPIASRCGVFAKTDVQALFNQGATKSDVADSIYQAVVSQTITGLA